ncbi:MAG: DUF4157 domain-containing protein [Symploca sp. SIO2D2]|nr:DUF4157 domain-containing protein [Symploca sp. SIO2D2]
MTRQYINRSNSATRTSTPTKEAITLRSSYGSLSSVVQRAEVDPQGVRGSENDQIESAIGARASREILGRQVDALAPGNMGISQGLWGVGNPMAVPIQAKLTIGDAGDKYEQEADRVAMEVVERINDRRVVRKEQKATEEGRPSQDQRISVISRKVQPKAGAGCGAASPAFERGLNRAKGGGRPLDAAFRGKVEPVMGADFSGVRVHTDWAADQLSRSIQAKAFTSGHDVFMSSNRYNAGSREGQMLLAHELTHVVQQKGDQRGGRNLSKGKKGKDAIQRKVFDSQGKILSDEQISRLKELFYYRHGNDDLELFKIALDKYHKKPSKFFWQTRYSLEKVAKDLMGREGEQRRVGYLLKLIIHEYENEEKVRRDTANDIARPWQGFLKALRFIGAWQAHIWMNKYPTPDDVYEPDKPQGHKTLEFRIWESVEEDVKKIHAEQWQAAAVAMIRMGKLSKEGYKNLANELSRVIPASEAVFRLTPRDLRPSSEGEGTERRDGVGGEPRNYEGVSVEELNKGLGYFAPASLLGSGNYKRKNGIITKGLDYGHKAVDCYESYWQRDKRHVASSVKFDYMALLSPGEESEEVRGANGQVLSDGSYMYTIGEDGLVRYMPAANYVGEGEENKDYYQYIPHSQLANKERVRAAGNFRIVQGKFIWLDNGSGHYRVTSSVNNVNARHALVELGYDMSRVKFYDRGNAQSGIHGVYREGNNRLGRVLEGTVRPAKTDEINHIIAAMKYLSAS